jgi:hypothetical protein
MKNIDETIEEVKTGVVMSNSYINIYTNFTMENYISKILKQFCTVDVYHFICIRKMQMILYMILDKFR